jgi:predicted nucleic acid-binding Zn ribbon protein
MHRILALLAIAGVPPHAHCEICGTPVEVGQRRCGAQACEDKFQESLKAKKRGMWLFIGVIFVVLVLSMTGRLGFTF